MPVSEIDKCVRHDAQFTRIITLWYNWLLKRSVKKTIQVYANSEVNDT
jgi:hypothetical protein